jgi:nucleoporin NDC1
MQQAFAFWELVYIAQHYQGRRKVIFEDIDRKGGSAWSQILAICIEVITGINSRITEFQAPPVAVKQTAKEEQAAPLPRLGQPLKDGLKQSGDLFSPPATPTTKTSSVVHAVGSFAKAHGQSPPSPSPNARKLLAKAESAVLTPDQKKAVEANGVGGLFQEKALSFLHTSFGWPFRQEYRRRIAAVVLGSPYGDVGIIVDAIDSLTRLAVCSLAEDKYGNVQRDVKLIIQTLTASVTKLEAFKFGLPFHWTDVEKKRESPEVDAILASLKEGLNELIDAFGNYSEDLRLSQSEMRLAREAATPARVGKEMEQTGK